MSVEIEGERLSVILRALGRSGSAVHDAHEENGCVILLLSGDVESIVYVAEVEQGAVEVDIPFPDDLTAIPGIGDATATLLRAAGFHTFEDLINADDVVILDVVGFAVLRRIRKYLKEHCL